MFHEIRNLLGYLLLSLALIIIAEVVVSTFGTPRLWALMATFTLGYLILAVVKWHRRAATPAPPHADRTGSKDMSSPDAEKRSSTVHHDA
ncbi:hypothetical protein GCM10009591_38830 [Brachybacterium tyrofermentans]